MFRSLWEDLKKEFQDGNMVSRLIIVNVTVWLVVLLLHVLLGGLGERGGFMEFVYLFSMSYKFKNMLIHPWSPITALFLHVDFGHILSNMLFLYWFGRIVTNLLGNQRILPLYLLCGLVGDFAYLLAGNFSSLSGDAGVYAYGASAAVFGLVGCAAYTAPDYKINVFFASVELKYIALAMILLNMYTISSNNFNTGGNFAHLGGAAFGVLYASNLQKGIDLGKPLSKLIRYLTRLLKIKPYRKEADYEYERFERVYRNTRNQPKQESKPKSDPISDPNSPQVRLDSILDKIKQSGYDSLSKEDKAFLFEASK
jgi:membrane associated rhomboid family serine protease